MRHAHVQIEFAGKVIQVDPWNIAPSAMLKPADLILVTDVHSDHLDPGAIDRVKKASTQFVVPAAVGSRLGSTVVLSNGERRVIDGVTVEAVPMYNVQRRGQDGALYHTKGRGNGYVLTLGDKRIYFSGDTECTPEVKALANIDVAFVSANLPFTMPPSEAVECVKAFRPKVVYLYHYQQQGIQPRNKNQIDFAEGLKGESGIEVRMPDFYPPR